MSSKLRDYLALYSSNQYKTNCTIDYSYYSFAISASWRRKEWFKYTEKGTPFLFHKARYLVDRKELLTLSYKVYLVTFTEFIILDVFKQETSSSLFACRWQTSAFYFALAQYISSLLRKDSDQSKLCRWLKHQPPKFLFWFNSAEFFAASSISKWNFSITIAISEQGA